MNRRAFLRRAPAGLAAPVAVAAAAAPARREADPDAWFTHREGTERILAADEFVASDHEVRIFDAETGQEYFHVVEVNYDAPWVIHLPCRDGPCAGRLPCMGTGAMVRVPRAFVLTDGPRGSWRSADPA